MASAPLMPLSEKQMASLCGSTSRVTIFEGAIRSGKTIVSLLRWLIYVANAPLGGQLVVVARTRDTASRNVFAPLMDETLFGEIAQHVEYTSGAPTAKILGRTVFVIGASDAKAEKTLRGLTVAGAYVDEATVLDEQFFTQLLGRMSVPGAQLFATTNPDSPSHWLKKKFLDRLDVLGDWKRFHFVMTDNPSLQASYIESASREFTGLWRRRFILGEWVAAEGAIYPEFEASKHIVRWADLPPMYRLLGVGVDFGTTNATAALLLGLAHTFDEKGQRNGSRLYLIDEWRYDPSVTQRRLTNADLSSEFRQWLYGVPHLPYNSAVRAERVIIDPAAASFRVQLQEDGVQGLMSADNAVSYGIGHFASLLGTDRLFISDRCTGLIEEIPGYSWDPKATEQGMDKPIKVADHSLDAARYVITTTENLWRSFIN